MKDFNLEADKLGIGRVDTVVKVGQLMLHSKETENAIRNKLINGLGLTSQELTLARLLSRFKPSTYVGCKSYAEAKRKFDCAKEAELTIRDSARAKKARE